MEGGNRAITISLLITLLRNVEDEEILILFLKEYERFVLHLLIAAKKRFSAPNIYEVIQLLNQKKIKAAMDKFCLKVEELHEMKDAIVKDDFKDNDIAKLFIARFYWAERYKGVDTVSEELIYENTTLEHIIPQTPDENTN